MIFFFKYEVTPSHIKKADVHKLFGLLPLYSHIYSPGTYHTSVSEVIINQEKKKAVATTTAANATVTSRTTFAAFGAGGGRPYVVVVTEDCRLLFGS